MLKIYCLLLIAIIAFIMFPQKIHIKGLLLMPRNKMIYPGQSDIELKCEHLVNQDCFINLDQISPIHMIDEKYVQCNVTT